MAKYNDNASSAFYPRLGEYALFKEIAESDLEAVLGCVGARIEKYEKNTFVMLDMDDVICAGLILEGKVAIVKEDEHGHQSLIAYMTEGEVFGETFALSRDRVLAASYKTMTKCTIMYLSVSKVLNTCRNNCPFHRRLIINLFDCVTRKNAMLIRKIDIVSRNTIRGKIMAYLQEVLRLTNEKKGTPDNQKIQVPLNKMEMAQYLSVNRSALARELSGYQASVTVLEKGSDIAEGATKANSGIIHAGYDAMPGSLKAYYNVLGSSMYPSLCSQLNIPYRRCGALVIALDEKESKSVEALKKRGESNGVENLSLIGKDEILALEPNVNPQVVCALNVPDSAIISPYEAAYAFADNAAVNNTTFLFDQTVENVIKNSNGFTVQTNSDTFHCHVLINCAGSFGAEIHNILCEEKLEMTHRRGQYYLLDRSSEQPFSRTVFQCPSNMGKGVLLSPTVHGNMLIGPTAEDISDPCDTATTAEGLSEIIRKAVRTWPALSIRQNITNFSGIRGI